MPRFGNLLALGLGALFVFAAACGRAPRECAEVTAALAGNDAALSAALDGDAGSLASRVQAAAAVADVTAAQLSNVHVADAALSAATTEYAATSRELGTAGRSFADALAQMDATDEASSTLAADAARAQDGLRRACPSPSRDCLAVDAARQPVVGDAFQRASRAEQAKALDAAADAVSSLAPGDAGVARAATAYAGVLRLWADELRGEERALAAVGDGQRRFAELVARRGQIEDRIHATCGSR